MLSAVLLRMLFAFYLRIQLQTEDMKFPFYPLQEPFDFLHIEGEGNACFRLKVVSITGCPRP